MKYLAVVSIFIDFYKEGYLSNEEYEAVEIKIVKKCEIDPLSIYRILVVKLK
jgi:hypothetical protein